MVERRLIAVQGIVQGVGFRPYVHRLAAAHGLSGSVSNDPSGVTIDVEGDTQHLDDFLRMLTLRPPPHAAIARVDISAAAPQAYTDFRIGRSVQRAGESGGALVPADLATCSTCQTELADPGNRRFGHAFISCTECGPRLTVVRDTPYDRERTTMAGFAMCAACRQEYEDPRDRRFHAETIACHECGPVLTAVRNADDAAPLHRRMALEAAITALRDGRIVAIKALGGFHLACDATSEPAVTLLRARKGRVAKPFALMVRDVAAARALCTVSNAERDLLESPAHPIVLLEQGSDARVAPSVAPGQSTLGLMLPSTPVHHLLLAALDRPLVMTSGNRSDEPVVIDERLALSALGDVADLFLMHDRPIAVRCDDSVVRVIAGKSRVLRRSRGYAPRSVPLGTPTPLPVLALGGHLKSAICVASGTRAILSPHIGDLDSWPSRQALRDAVDATIRLAGATPAAVAYDLHPEYASTLMAHALTDELRIARTVAVQHHHAHVAACIAEYDHRGPVIGVAFDGTGLGTDGAIWGGEFLLVEGARFERRGHLAYVPLPGGDAVARRPWRSAASHLAGAGLPVSQPRGVSDAEWNVVRQLLARPDQPTRTSSVGRLFDAVASLLGVCHVSRFEGEAAMALEAVADKHTTRVYGSGLTGNDMWTADPGEIVRSVLDDLDRGRPVAEIAGAFHRSLCRLVVAGCSRVREYAGVGTVVLTGGVFMNSLLSQTTSDALAAKGFQVLMPSAVPCNDGGIALGQAYVASHALREEPCA